MGLFRADGTRITRSTISTVPAHAADPFVTINEDVYESFSADKPNDPKPEGGLRRIFARKGKLTLRTSELDRLFPAPTITSVTPADGVVTGGQEVTITGTNLDGVSAVRFGDDAADSFVVKSSTRIVAIAPEVEDGGWVAVSVVDDGGTATLPDAFRYLA